MADELVPGFHIRMATEQDHNALLSVCLRTGNSGADATGMDADEDLLGLFYAVPYQMLEPDHCFVITHDDEVCGYVMGTVHTLAFNARFQHDWLPALQKRIPPPPTDQTSWQGLDWLRARVHQPEFIYNNTLMRYPAHGHIDLLPQARGKGVGKAALTYLMNNLATAGARGIHLQVSPQNTGALAFYQKLGFKVLKDDEFPDHTVFMGKVLP